MPDLDTALDEIRGFASRPPGGGPDLDRIVALAARRHRNQRITGTVAVLLLAVVVLAVAVTAGSSSDTPPVGPTTTSTVPGRPTTLTVVPSVDLSPDDYVAVTLPVPPGADDVVAQCSSEADSQSPEGWCDLGGTRAEAEGDEDFRIQVRRVISTSNGLIDCAERPGRCVIGVRSGGTDYLVPISFRTDLPDLVTPTLDVEPTGTGTIRVTGAGYEPGAELFVRQCRPSAGQANTDALFGDCDYARTNRPLADAAGRFQIDVTLYRDVFEAYTGWSPCSPCQVQVQEHRSPTTAAVVDTAGASTARPRVEIVTPGPYRSGQLVELHGSGFSPAAPAGTDVTVEWCRFVTDNPTQEASGAGPQYATCAYPGGDVAVESDGTFTIRDFPLPDGTFGYNGASCESPDSRCGLAWHPSEGSLPVFVTEFTIER
jgi:hypothetical protein